MVDRFREFCNALHERVLTEGVDSIDELAEELKRVLVDPAFISETFMDGVAPPQRVLFSDEQTNARVLAHIHSAGKSGKPHSHGASWAIYGNVRGATDMTEWRRINPQTEDHAVIEAYAHYRLEPGQTRAYRPHLIHSTSHPDGAWVIRITGTDLSTIPRFRFNPEKDVMIQASAV